MLDVGRTRFLMYEQSVTGVSMPLVVMLIVWLTLIFISFGLFAPRNFTVVGSFFVSALSVAGALLLILEMYSPFAGFIQNLAGASPGGYRRTRLVRTRHALYH